VAQKAIELVADSAKPIPKEEADERQAEADDAAEKAENAEKILAPEGEEKPAGKLWTPARSERHRDGRSAERLL